MSMECNKDEALRAKEIAENKMLISDFDGARRIALKAQHLFPELENITQLLTVCDVHCSAESRILGSEKDWYRILQVERLADEATIRKQYRKLALVLHPDKNKFPGAEAAFKLIGEANVVLSDQVKRSLFDRKIGITLKSAPSKPPSKKVTMNPPASKVFVGQNNYANGFNSQFSGLNHYQTAQTKSTAVEEPFWTCCPFCNIRYQYYRDVENKYLRCQNCLKPYVAYDLAAQGAPGSNLSQAAAQGAPGSNLSQAAAPGAPGSNLSQAAAPGAPGSNQSQAAAQGVPCTFNQSQPTVSKRDNDPIQPTYRNFGQKTGESKVSNFGSQRNASIRSVGSVSGAEMSSSVKAGMDNATKANGKGSTPLPRYVKLPDEGSGLRNKNRKRGRKPESESSESCHTSSSSDMEGITVNGNSSSPADGISSGVNAFDFVRRSCRQKHQVSYTENVSDDDDFQSPPKRSHEGKSNFNVEGRQEGITNDGLNPANPNLQKDNVSSLRASTNGYTKVRKNPSTRQTAGAPNSGARKVEIIVDPESDDGPCPCPESFDIPDPEFHDFDKDKEESCFAVDQFWACYDDVDGMPRFYAQIREIYSPGFKLRITWLEPHPDDEGEIHWAASGLPFGCGKFKCGDSEVIEGCLTFSHQLVCEKGSHRGSFMVYPKKGEIWALFKDWDIKWSDDPDNWKKFKYEIVEVVSNFKEHCGIQVVLLERLNGFVSLFQQSSQNRAASILVPPTKMLRFSHRIPCFKMGGTEKENVPEGSFELDPACLPANPDDICYPSVVEAGVKNTTAEANLSNQTSYKINEPKLSLTENTLKKPGVCVSESVVVRETGKLRRSPRGLNIVDEENRHGNASESLRRERISNDLKGKESDGCCEFSPSMDDVITRQDVKNIVVQMQESSPSKRNSIHHSLCHKFLDNLSHDFQDRSMEKFEVNQIWALYAPEHKFPKMYGQIKRIVHSPFRLFVALLESISGTEGKEPACGTFKVRGGKPKGCEPSSFSHLMEAKIGSSKNTVEIYPRVEEVWALYRNWNAGLTSYELKNCEFQLVEIAEISDGCTRVSPLAPVTPRSPNLIFRSPRKQRSGGLEKIDIQGKDLARFSHRVPALRLTTEKAGSLAGSWLVDPAALPRSTLSRK